MTDSTAAQAVEAFDFLTERGFVATRSEDFQRESVVDFEKADVRVGVLIESFAVTVHVGRKRPDGRLSENYGLLHLVADAFPEDEARLRAEEQSVAERLAVAAELLEKAGADVLAGDFSRRDRLKRLRAERQRVANKQEWGTSTGETPRFSERPELAALFEDASNDGIREARAYQAFWDWHYPLVEIGEFLGVSESDVQAMLDRWDGL